MSGISIILDDDNQTSFQDAIARLRKARQELKAFSTFGVEEMDEDLLKAEQALRRLIAKLDQNL